jgi:hypothetical protein
MQLRDAIGNQGAFQELQAALNAQLAAVPAIIATLP